MFQLVKVKIKYFTQQEHNVMSTLKWRSVPAGAVSHPFMCIKYVHMFVLFGMWTFILGLQASKRNIERWNKTALPPPPLQRDWDFSQKEGFEVKKKNTGELS